MKQIFIDNLIKLAEKDENIYLLCGDLGFSVLEKFRDKFPKRFINTGVAEANMIGVAAGLALSGKTVFVYSIIPFLIMRSFEQIRNDICYQDLDVRLIGVGSGLGYGSAGFTHHAIEDIAIMRALPNMKVICPGDFFEIEKAIQSKGPVYIRLDKSSENKIHSNKINSITKGITIKDGKGITIFVSGDILYEAKQVSEELKSRNIDVRLISMPMIKPIDKEIILKSAKETKAIFTIEEHSLIGGLGSAVAEILSEENKKIIFKRIALPDKYCKKIGNHKYLKEKNNLSMDEITKNILKIYNNGK